MPKILIAQSQTHKKDRKVATSMQNLKALIEKRIEKDAEDKVYNVVTINTKMKLANVVALFNGTQKSLAEHEGVLTVETYTIDPEKTRGRWEIEAQDVSTGSKKAKKKDAEEEPAADEPKAKKKKKKKAKKED